jgi:hypothetical protein
MRDAIAVVLAVLLIVSGSAQAAAQHRLPKGYHWGRCLLVSKGKTLISGTCAYQIREKGGFYITGPKQVWEGIDYQNPQHSGAGEMSRDYWAVVDREDDGSWTGYGNADIRATHGDDRYGTLTKKGACFEGSELGPVKVCLWRK